MEYILYEEKGQVGIITINREKALNALKQLQESYTISMMTSLVGLDKNMIMDALINDDIFILLEELNSLSDKESFKAIIEPALARLSKEDSAYILKVLQEGFDYLDSTFKKNKKSIILFSVKFKFVELFACSLS